MNTTRQPSHHDLDRIGRTIDAAGFSAVPASLIDAVVAYAERHHLRPVATSVLADPAAPAVARVRAFGLVSLSIGSHLGRPLPKVTAA